MTDNKFYLIGLIAQSLALSVSLVLPVLWANVMLKFLAFSTLANYSPLE